MERKDERKMYAFVNLQYPFPIPLRIIRIAYNPSGKWIKLTSKTSLPNPPNNRNALAPSS